MIIFVNDELGLHIYAKSLICQILCFVEQTECRPIPERNINPIFKKYVNMF